MATTHGLCHHPLYKVWKDFRERCNNSKIPNYHRYGGRGIKVCDEWNSDFKKFYDWAIDKWKPGLTIDRINNDGNYCPENCRFVTSKENCNNTSRSIFIDGFGKRMTISQWGESEHCLVDKTCFKYRMESGWELEKALKTPSNKETCKSSVIKIDSIITAFLESKTVREWLTDSRCEISEDSLLYRLNNGWDYEEAITTKRYDRSDRILAFNSEKTIREWSQEEICKCSFSCLNQRIKRGWNPEEAITTEQNRK